MKHKTNLKSVISLLLSVAMLISVVPMTTFAAQSNEYVDPADNWLNSNGRTNELDVNATTTYETQYCCVCDKATMKILSICITVVIFGRMIEIYLYSSVGAIPFATMTNREWGQVGSNYLRGLVALGFQGFFIMVCVGIYAALVNSFTATSNIHSTIFSVAAYTVVLCFTLFKTGTISKSIFNAH